MSYLEEFEFQAEERNISKLLTLWEEYCTNDTADAKELLGILRLIKNSDFADTFGKYVEAALPLWQGVKEEKLFFEVLQEILDLQTTNNPVLADAAYQLLEQRFGSQREFNERIRLIGLRARDTFQGAISHYVLLNHMQKGKFVYHKAGWGTGEIMEISLIREQLSVEFENVPAVRSVTFPIAFKTLIPLEDDHFLARRFGDPDLLEAEAKKDAIGLVEMLLRDLGPKTASEIKEEVCELIIPEEEWSRWWQGARAKLKKHPLITAPESQREPFRLRKEALTHEERIESAVHEEQSLDQQLQSLYQLVRDHPHLVKDASMKESIVQKAHAILQDPQVSECLSLQVDLFLKHLLHDDEAGKRAEEMVRSHEDILSLIEEMEIVALKKRAMMMMHRVRSDWKELFLQLFTTVSQGQLRDFLLIELNKAGAKEDLMETLQTLLHRPLANPDLFVWYFQKIATHTKKELPFSQKEGICNFFEGFFILLSEIESKDEYRDLTKKMVQLLTQKRYALVREVIEGTSLDYIKEFLLLVSKCHSLTENDKSIMRSLAEVVYPELSEKKRSGVDDMDGHIIWTTEEGYLKVQDRIREIGTKEMIEVAREIETARSYGDLRENSEYKYALEKRARLQSEMKILSEQLNRARVITYLDITPGEVCVGSIVKLQDSHDKVITYTILGPWDANTDENILSFQSLLAQTMLGCHEGESFRFKDEEYKVMSLSNRFAKE